MGRDTSPRDPIRTVLVGYDTEGRVQAGLIAATPGLTLSHVVSTVRDYRCAAQRDHPGAQVVQDINEALQTAEPGLLVFSVRQSRGPGLIVRGLRSGWHVACDRPLTVDSEDAWTCVQSARQFRRTLTCLHLSRWDDDFRTAQALARTGALGRVTNYQWRFHRPRSGDPLDWGRRFWDPVSDGVDQALQLLGPVARVSASLDREAAEGLDGESVVRLYHANGAQSELRPSVTEAELPTIRLTGELATFEATGVDPQESQLLAGISPTEPGLGLRPTNEWAWVWGTRGRESVDVMPGSWLEFYLGLAEAIQAGTHAPASAFSAGEVVTILARARQAEERHTVVELDWGSQHFGHRAASTSRATVRTDQEEEGQR